MIDEVPVLAVVAAHARGETLVPRAPRELRVKETDRLAGRRARDRATLGGHAGIEGDDLVVAGGGLARRARRRAAATIGWRWRSRSARWRRTRPSEIDGMEAADVSFPGFVAGLRALGASDRGAT